MFVSRKTGALRYRSGLAVHHRSRQSTCHSEDSMKAALFERPHVFNVVRRDIRRLAPGEVLVRVDACGICGTDIHIVEGTSRSTPPVVLGHEYAGIVEDHGTVSDIA